MHRTYTASAASTHTMWQLSLGQFLHQPAQQARLDALPSMPLAVPRCLLYGPHRTGKTSLLFNFAYRLAASGSVVWLLCDRARLEQAPPLLPYGVDRASEPLSRIQLKYVHNLQQLRAFGACLHLLEAPPAAILVDDLSGLTAASRLPDRRSRDSEVNKALAFLVDGLEQLREHSSADVLLLVADTASEGDAAHGQMHLLQRWFPMMLAVTGLPGGAGSGPRSLTLQVAPARKQSVPARAARAAVTYSLTHSYLHVESVIT